jgi:hypothetical protein
MVSHKNDIFIYFQDYFMKLVNVYKLKSDFNYDYEEEIDNIIEILRDNELADIEVGEWHKGFQYNGTLYNTFTKRILAEPEIFINGHGEHIVIEKSHYMCEIFRIPLKCDCTLENIVKIACYTGLLLSSLRQDDFPKGFVKAFRNMGMNSLCSYIINLDLYKKISVDEVLRLVS